MDKIKTTEEAIGELLRLADENSDTVLKNIFSTYNPDAAHKTNVTNISSSKFKLESLEKCADFFKIPLLDKKDKKIFTKKAQLADRLVLKIESLFPQTCQECSETYCATVDDSDVFFTCFFLHSAFSLL